MNEALWGVLYNLSEWCVHRSLFGISFHEVLVCRKWWREVELKMEVRRVPKLTFTEVIECTWIRHKLQVRLINCRYKIKLVLVVSEESVPDIDSNVSTCWCFDPNKSIILHSVTANLSSLICQLTQLIMKWMNLNPFQCYRASCHVSIIQPIKWLSQMVEAWWRRPPSSWKASAIPWGRLQDLNWKVLLVRAAVVVGELITVMICITWSDWPLFQA